ncbi:MAG: hypothetical protein ACRDDX_07105 [Cellulosilyticaceae bacterium]
MLAEKNQGIEKAYSVLKKVSQDEVTRMAYEAREAEIRDQLTREKVAREEGIEKGIEKGIEQGIEKGIKRGIEKRNLEVAKNLLLAGVDIDIIKSSTGLDEVTIKTLQ